MKIEVVGENLEVFMDSELEAEFRDMNVPLPPMPMISVPLTVFDRQVLQIHKQHPDLNDDKLAIRAVVRGYSLHHQQYNFPDGRKPKSLKKHKQRVGLAYRLSPRGIKIALWLILLMLVLLLGKPFVHAQQNVNLNFVRNGTNFWDAVNNAVRVNVVAGGAGGGLAQMQVGRASDGAFTNVGFFAGQQNVPVNCIVGCAGGSSTPSDAFANPTTAGLQQTFNMLYNGTTWDRARGDTTNGLWVNCKNGCAGGSSTPTDAFANPTTAGLSMGFNMMWNGATWDRVKGDTTSGIWINVKNSTLAVTQSTSPWVISFTTPQHVIVDSFGSTIDVSDRAARLLGVVYGSQGQQLKQTATNFNLQVETAVGGTLIDPRSIRALTNADVVKSQLQDNAGNGLTTNSTTYTAKFGLDGNWLGTLGTAFSTPGFVDIKGADGNIFVRQTTGSNLHMVCDSGCTAGGSFLDSSAFTFGTTAVSNTSFVVDDVATNTVAENSAGAARMSTNRIIYFDLSKSPANTTAGLVSVKTDPTTLGTTNAVTNYQLARTTGALTSTTCPGTGCVSLSTTGYGVAVLTISGTYSLTPLPEFSDDGGTTWYGTTCTQTDSAAQVVTFGALVNISRAWNCPVFGASNFRIRASAFTSGTANIGITLSSAPVGVASTVALTSGSTVAATQSGTWTVQPGNTANTTAWKVDGSAVTQPISGTVTANQGTAAAAANRWPVTVSDGTNSMPTMDAAARKGFVQPTDGTNNMPMMDAAARKGFVQPTDGTNNAAFDADNGAAAGTNRTPTLPCVYQTSYRNGTAATQGKNGAAGCGTDGLTWVASLPAIRPASYVASSAFAGSSTTDNAVMPGNASNTVLVTSVRVSCTQTTAGSITLTLIKRSTADTVGTSAAMTAVPDDSNYAAAVSAPLSYTGTGPTVGTPVGNVDNVKLGCEATTTAAPQDIYILNRRQKPIVLRGTAQQLAVNAGNAAITGGNLTVTFEWIETASILP